MKKKIASILAIVSGLIIISYIAVANINNYNKPTLTDLSGDRKELGDISVSVGHQAIPNYLTYEYILNKDNDEKVGIVQLDNVWSNFKITDDKRFFRDSGMWPEEYYEDNESRFSVSSKRKYEDNRDITYLVVKYRNKETNEYVQFNIESDYEWGAVQGVYSKGRVQKVVFASENGLVIANIDLNNKSITQEKIIEMEEPDKRLRFRYTESNVVNNGTLNMLNIDNDFTKCTANGISINLLDHSVNKVNMDFKVDLERNYDTDQSGFYNYSNNIYYYEVINNNVTLIKYNTENQIIEKYEDIQIKDEKNNGVVLTKAIVEDNKIYIAFVDDYQYSYEIKDLYINIIDSKTKENLYVGKINTSIPHMTDFIKEVE